MSGSSAEKGAALAMPRRVEPEEIACWLVGLRYPQREDAPFKALAARRQPEPDRVLIAVAGPEGPCEIELRRRDDDEPAFVRTPHLDVSYRAESSPRRLVRLVKHVAARLAGVDYDAIVRVLPPLASAGDAAGEGGSGSAPAGDPYDRQRGVHESWAHPDRWRLFLAGSELARARDTAVQVALPWIWIEHGDAECRYVGIGDFVHYPWRSPWRAPAAPGGPRSRGDDAPIERGSFFTDLTDMEVIGGGTDRLADLFDAVREEAAPRLVSVNCTCVPLMIGDEVATVVDEERERSPFPILYQAQSEEHPYQPHIMAMAERSKQASPRARDPHAVNLVGFPEQRGTEEIGAHLRRLGVRVHQRLIPRMAPQMMDTYLEASAQVILENADWQGMVDFLLGDLDIVSCMPPPPYGIARSIAWLREVVEAVGLSEAAEAAIAELESDFRARLAPLHAEALGGGYGIGLVIEADDLARLADPARLFSLPLLATLEELGYTIHLAIFDDGSVDRSRLTAEVRALFEVPERHQLAWFRTPDELDAWLRGAAVRLVYTDYLYDYRVTSAGKCPVSVFAFELGLDGAIRTAERLLLLCRSDFYADSARYLARDARSAPRGA